MERTKFKNDFKVSYSFNPSGELLDFADYFSNNWETLNCGVYESDNKEYTIKYEERLLDQRTGQEVNTNVRVGLSSGIIEISKKRLIELNTNKNYLFFIILWCIAQHRFNEYYKSDIQTIKYYISTGRPIMEVIECYIELFKTAESNLNRERMERIINSSELKEELRKKMLRKLIS